MKKLFALTLGVVLVAGSALASNTGFKLNYTLRQAKTAGGSNVNWVSVPFFYYANGNVGDPEKAKDLCWDLNEGNLTAPPKVNTVYKWDVLNDKAISFGCTSPASLPTNFPLVSGEGYAAKPVADNIVVNIVGSHDDSYAPNKLNTKGYLLHQGLRPGSSNVNWTAIPYHSTANNAKDLCTQINTPTQLINTMYRWDTLNDKAVSFGCSSPATLPTNFALIPGEGSAMKPVVDPADIRIPVY